jgi:hypothetical protein
LAVEESDLSRDQAWLGIGKHWQQTAEAAKAELESYYPVIGQLRFF